MELAEEDGNGRRRYSMYSIDPGYTQDGTDFAAIADGCIAVTPLHFDLNDQAAIDRLSGFQTAAGARRPRGGERGTEGGEPPAELRKQLEYHGHRYYVLDDPEVSTSSTTHR